MSTRKTDSPQGWLSAELERIRNRRDLSEEGKIAHVGRAYLAAKKAAEQQRAAAQAEWQSEYDALLGPLLSPPGGHTAEWRRLRDQAVAVADPDKVMRYLESALATGDTLEARAYGAAALDKALAGGPTADRWVAVLNRWGQSDPRIDQTLTELSEHRAGDPNTVSRRLGTSVARPAELRGNGWERLVHMADADDGSDMTPEGRKHAHDMAVTFRGGRDEVG